MRKFVLATIGGVLAGALLTTQVAGPLIAQDVQNSRSVYQQLELFGDIFERIRTNYVDEVEPADLIQAAIQGMLTSLDPHSGYLPPDDYAAMREQTRGEFGGLGIDVTLEDGLVKVVAPRDGTPADAAGILAGDFITHVDGESVMGLTIDQAVEIMRGPVGSEVVITIQREGRTEPFDLSLIRDTIRLTAVSTRMEGDVIVVRVVTFSDQTFPNLRDGITESIAAAGGVENISGLVLDLRNNPGGLLNQAIRVADAFLDQGEIVSTRGRTDASAERFNATAGDMIDGQPLVVLINGGSASASEIVAGALQDHRRAIVVGTRSFGKGSVQTIMPVRGDGAMRLTTARYYTPSGRSIQTLGVAPDVVVEQPVNNAAEPTDNGNSGNSHTESDLRGGLANDSVSDEEMRQMQDERRAAEDAARLRQQDYQLAYALDILRGLAAINGR